jgi:hypothetical protein
MRFLKTETRITVGALKRRYTFFEGELDRYSEDFMMNGGFRWGLCRSSGFRRR